MNENIIYCDTNMRFAAGSHFLSSKNTARPAVTQCHIRPLGELMSLAVVFVFILLHLFASMQASGSCSFRPARAASSNARLHTGPGAATASGVNAGAPPYTWPEADLLSRGGEASGMFAHKNGEPTLLPNPLHKMDACPYKGGTWPYGMSFGRRAMCALVHIGKALPERYKRMPDDDELVSKWNEYRSAAAARYTMSEADVEHAMHVMFPLYYNGQCSERDKHVADSPCIDMGHNGDVRHKHIYPRRYFQVHLGRRRMISLHRLVLFLMAGPPHARDDDESLEPAHAPTTDDAAREMIDGTHAIHLCDNKRCINWLHLTWGSARFNNVMRVYKQWMEPPRYRAYRIKCITNRNLRLPGRHKEMPTWFHGQQQHAHT